MEKATRREVIKKAAFVAPLILTLPAAASFAQAGSNDFKRPRTKPGRPRTEQNQDGQGQNQQ